VLRLTPASAATCFIVARRPPRFPADPEIVSFAASTEKSPVFVELVVQNRPDEKTYSLDRVHVKE
jgi:hypothetical protein